MDLNYLLSILDLYLLKEQSDHLIIEIHDNNIIKVECSYASSKINKTYVKIDKNIFFDNLNFIISKIQSNLNIKNEVYNDNIYKVIFDNNREISFIKFNNKDLINIRNSFNNTIDNFSFEKIEVDNNINYNKIYKETKKNKFSYSLGFSSFMTIFLTSIWFLDILLIALWIFKAMK